MTPHQWVYLAINLFMSQSSRTCPSHTLKHEQQIKHLHNTWLEFYCTSGLQEIASCFVPALHPLPLMKTHLWVRQSLDYFAGQKFSIPVTQSSLATSCRRDLWSAYEKKKLFSCPIEDLGLTRGLQLKERCLPLICTDRQRFYDLKSREEENTTGKKNGLCIQCEVYVWGANKAERCLCMWI